MYFLKSDTDYHNIIDFLSKFDDVYGVRYYVISRTLKLKNGCFIGLKEGKNIALKFNTYFLDIKKQIMIKDCVDPNSLIKFHEIDEDEIELSFDRKSTIIKGFPFMEEKELFHNLEHS